MHVIHIISSLRRGGRERQLAGILKNNNTFDNEKAIVFNKKSNSYEEEYDLTGKLIYLKSKNALLRFFEIIRIVNTEKPSIIWSWGGMEATYALLLSAITPIKHINGSIRHGIVLYNFKHQWRKLILILSKHIVANSHAGLKANGLKRGVVLYNGIEESFFNHKVINPDREGNLSITEIIKSKTPVLVSVANLVPFKDYSTVLQALEILTKKGLKFAYIIIGEGPDRISIENVITEKGLNSRVTLLGRRHDVNDIVAIGDIFVHSSKGEGCSNAIIEALAAGLPVVASDTGGTGEIINTEIGLLFNYRDAQQLASHLEQLLTDKNKLTSMKIAAKRYARTHFSMDTMIGEYNKIINCTI